MKVFSVVVLSLVVCVIVYGSGTIPEEYSGPCGVNLTFEYNPNTYTLTISGTGTMRGFSLSNIPWGEYRTDIKYVDIEEGVACIGSNAFLGCTSMKGINIASTVEYIEDCAFQDCRNLTMVMIPPSVTSIHGNAFQGCTALTSISFPQGVTSIYNAAFADCTSLSTITIPSSVTFIGGDAFRGCDGVNVTYLGSSEPSFCDVFNSISMTDICAPIDYNSKSFCGRPLFTNITITDDIRKHNNECEEVIGCSNAITIQKRPNANEWEDRTDGCIEYKCDKDKGTVINVLCETGGDEICYNGRCVNKESLEEGVLKLFLETDNLRYNELDYDELKATIIEMSGVGTDALDIGVDVDENGNILSIVLVLKNKDDVDSLLNSLKNCYADDN